MANQFTTKEVLNKVLLDSSGNSVAANSHTSPMLFSDLNNGAYYAITSDDDYYKFVKI
jgi:hypothetical protein